MEVNEIRANLNEAKNNVESVSDSFSDLQSLIKERTTLIKNVKDSYDSYLRAVINTAQQKSGNHSTRIVPMAIDLPFNRNTYDETTVEYLYVLIRYINIFNKAKELNGENSDIPDILDGVQPLLKEDYRGSLLAEMTKNMPWSHITLL